MIPARKTEDGSESAPAISGRGELLGSTLLVIVIVIGFALSAVANRLEFALLGLGASLVIVLLRRRPVSAARLAAVGVSTVFFDAVLVGLHEEQLRLGLLYYGAPAGLATPLVWLGAAALAGAGLAAAQLHARSDR